jgi:hypothetical protein
LVVAAFVVVAGGLASVVLWEEPAMEWLDARFPKGAHPPGAIFFALAALLVLSSLAANRRVARLMRQWPTVRGRIVGTSVDPFATTVGS